MIFFKIFLHLLQKYMSVLIETSYGDLVIDLFTNKCKLACLNFVKLCKMKHYNNALFAEVQKDYVTQIKTSNPTTIWALAQKDKNQYFKDQIDLQFKLNHLGLVATANNGNNLNNSQFFITLTKANLTSLNGKHTVFGKIQQGLDILKKINQTYVDAKSRPKMNIRILHTFVLYDPFQEEFKNMKVPSSPILIGQSDRLEAVEHFSMMAKNKTQAEIVQATRLQKAKKQAVTLEMLGDLPDADVKPPENILFVCKLNPITQQRDLEIIFSRFGPIKSVQIVRDWKTGQSLQYGFIQFQSPNACQQAFLKMENVVIDERRIHVDFSQSVTKLIPKSKAATKQVKSTKSGQMRQKMKDLVTKVKDGKNFYGQTKYDFVVNKPKKQSSPIRKKYRRQQSSENEKSDRSEKISSSSESRSREKQRKKSKKSKHRHQKKKHKRDS